MHPSGLNKTENFYRVLDFYCPHSINFFKKFWKSDRTPNEPLYTHILYQILTFRKLSHFIEKSVPSKLRNSVQSKLRAQFFYSESFIAYSHNIWNFICPLPSESQENSNYNYTKLTFKLCTVLWRGGYFFFLFFI